MGFLVKIFIAKHGELKIVFATLAILVSLPAIAVVTYASAGISLISEALAAVNPITHLVEIFDPDGNKVYELELSTVWPVHGVVTDEFGSHTAFRKERGYGPHTGIDIANPNGLVGDPVTTFAAGKVILADTVDDSNCGLSVAIDHGHNIVSRYCHLLAVSTAEGVDVVPGDIIGLEGSTGASTGPHLHFMIEVYGVPINPRTFMVGEPELTPLSNSNIETPN